MENFEDKNYIFIYGIEDNKKSHTSPWLIEIENQANHFIDGNIPVLFYGLEGTSKSTLIFNIKKYNNKPLIVVKPDIIHEPEYLRAGVIGCSIKIKREYEIEPIIAFEELDMIVPQHNFGEHDYDYDRLKSTLQTIVSLLEESSPIIGAIIATTNYPVRIEPKIRRLFQPGMLYCPIPNLKNRINIFNILLKPKICLTDNDIILLAERTKQVTHSLLFSLIKEINRRKCKTIKDIIDFLNCSQIRIPEEDIIKWQKENKSFINGIDFPCEKPF